jgi:hypothetical protein
MVLPKLAPASVGVGFCSMQPMCESEPMPEESSSSWSELLSELVRGFVLLRDLFGYVLPGAFFLLIGAQSTHLSSFEGDFKLPGADSHPWLFLLLLLAISYILGQFIVATSYLHRDAWGLLKLVVHAWTKTLPSTASEGQKEKHAARKTKQTQDDQDESDFLRFHREFPDIYIEYDRQSIIALLRRGLATGLVLGILVFYYLYTHPLRIMTAAGAIMLFNTLSVHFYIPHLRKNTLKAAREAAAKTPAK